MGYDMDVTAPDGNGWFDVSLAQARMDELLSYFSIRRPNTFRKVNSQDSFGTHRLKSTIPLEIIPGTCIAIALDENDPTRLVLLAGPTPKINGWDRFSLRLCLPGFQYPNPHKFVSNPIGSIHSKDEPGVEKPVSFKGKFPALSEREIEEAITGFEFEMELASSHELQRKIDYYGLRPAAVAIVGVTAAALSLTQCESDRAAAPQLRPAPISTSIHGR